MTRVETPPRRPFLRFGARAGNPRRGRKPSQQGVHPIVVMPQGAGPECYAFPQGGGCSIGNNDSAEQLMEQLMEYPLSPDQFDRSAPDRNDYCRSR